MRWLRNRDSPRALQLHTSLCDSSAVRTRPCGAANVSPTRLLGLAAVPFESLQNKTKKPPSGGFLFWLRNRDSNPNKQSQSLPCCRYTIPQYSFCAISLRANYSNTDYFKCQEFFNIFSSFPSVAVILLNKTLFWE